MMYTTHLKTIAKYEEKENYIVFYDFAEEIDLHLAKQKLGDGATFGVYELTKSTKKSKFEPSEEMLSPAFVYKMGAQNAQDVYNKHMELMKRADSSGNTKRVSDCLDVINMVRDELNYLPSGHTLIWMDGEMASVQDFMTSFEAPGVRYYSAIRFNKTQNSELKL